MLIKLLGNKKRLAIFFAVFLALCVLAACAGYYLLIGGYIKNNGVILKPSRDYPAREITYYLQNDPQWSGESIGGSGYTMGGAGCLITCVASSMCDLGVQITPQELNVKLTGVGGFDDAMLLWYKIREAVPEVDYRYSRIVSSDIIETDLLEGRLPIINVRYRGSGITHWLLVVGAQNGDFLVFDPLNKEMKPMPLATHGKVYAYRVLLPA